MEKQFENDVTNNTTCTICYETMIKPMVLNCGHTFYEKCTNTITSCATCRIPIQSRKLNFSYRDLCEIIRKHLFGTPMIIITPEPEPIPINTKVMPNYNNTKPYYGPFIGKDGKQVYKYPKIDYTKCPDIKPYTGPFATAN